MIIIYSPAGADERTWDFNPDTIRQSQAELIEKRYGARWEAFLQDVQRGSARARRVLLWHLMRLTHHNLRYDDTPDFAMGEVKVEHTRAELTDLRAQIMRVDMPDNEREAVMAQLGVALEDAAAREQGPDTDADDVGDVGGGKANSPTPA